MFKEKKKRDDCDIVLPVVKIDDNFRLPHILTRRCDQRKKPILYLYLLACFALIYNFRVKFFIQCALLRKGDFRH